MIERQDGGHRLAQAAADRLSGRHPDWAAAMLAEQATLSGVERWRWSVGMLRASLVPKIPGLLYPLAVIGALVLMTLYQWSADESLVTIGVLSFLALALGVIEPRRILVSGCALGVVVASVNAFERITGVRPAYETHVHHILSCLRWLILIAPALFCAAFGGFVRRRMVSTGVIF